MLGMFYQFKFKKNTGLTISDLGELFTKIFLKCSDSDSNKEELDPCCSLLDLSCHGHNPL